MITLHYVNEVVMFYRELRTFAADVSLAPLKHWAFVTNREGRGQPRLLRPLPDIAEGLDILPRSTLLVVGSAHTLQCGVEDFGSQS